VNVGIEVGVEVFVGRGVGLAVIVGVMVGGSPTRVNEPVAFQVDPTKIWTS
jgi:hypothetical protein